jgi:hypothetical protein
VRDDSDEDDGDGAGAGYGACLACRGWWVDARRRASWCRGGQWCSSARRTGAARARSPRAQACTGIVLDAMRLANAVAWRGSAVHGGVPWAVEMLQDKEMGWEGGQRDVGQRWPAWYGVVLLSSIFHFKRRWQRLGSMQGMQRRVIIKK